MKLKKLLGLGLALAMVVCFAVGCGGETQEETPQNNEEQQTSTIENQLLKEEEQKVLKTLAPLPEVGQGEKLAAVAFSMTNPFWITVSEGYEDAAQEYGVTIDVVAAQNEADENSQLEVMNNLLTKDYDAIAISAMTPFNLVPGVAQANEKGIKVVAVGTDLDDTAAAEANASVEAFVTMDFSKQGEMGAEYIMEKIGGSGKVAVIEGQAGADNSEQRKQGAIRGFEANGGEVVAVEAADWDRQKAYDAATNILQANPDLKGIMCANDEMALGVVEALKAAGKKDQVVVVGIDFIEEAKTSIEAGELDASIVMSPYLFGKAGLILALKSVQGQEIPETIYWDQYGLVDAENVADYDGWK